jgi:N-hydroxyarylamine O-acetyltransferase
MPDVDAYLRRLRLSHPGPPSLDSLFAMHRAHVTYVPYETLEIQLGRPTTVDPLASAERIIAGRGGYCYHLNGAFALLLEALGYDVSRHVGGVFSGQRDAMPGGHMALTVRLPGAKLAGEEWLVDVGLGDALYEPMPLRAGVSRQGCFTYRLQRRPDGADGWRFWHADNAGSFTGMDFAASPVPVDVFAPHHLRLSTSPSSLFVNVAQVGRRTATGIDFVQGCFFRQVDASGLRKRLLTSADEWFGVVREVFDMPLADVDAAQRAEVWGGLWERHERYMASLAA